MSNSTAADTEFEVSDLKPSDDQPTFRFFVPGWAEMVVVGIVCCTAFLINMMATRRGLSLNPDSMAYISAGINLANGDGLATLFGTPLTVFPPGMPAVVAAGTLFGIDDLEMLRIINSLCFAAVVLLSYVLLRRHVSSLVLVLGATVFVAASRPMLSVMAVALSEPVFLVIVLTFIIVMEDLLARPRNLGLMAAAIVLCWSAFLFRYSGAALIPIGVAVLLIGLRHVDARFAVKQAAIFSACAAVVPVAWLLRNRATDGTAMGPRAPSADGPATHSYRIMEAVGRWFWIAPGPVSATFATILGGLLIASLILAFWYFRTTGSPADRTTGSPADRQYPLLPLVAFCLGYVAYLTVAASSTKFNPLDHRLLSPIYVPLIVLAAIALDRLWSRLNTPKRSILGVILAAVLVLQVLDMLPTVGKFATGQGYAKEAWRQSELAATVSALSAQTKVVSNEPDGLWAQTRRQGIQLAPAGYSIPGWQGSIKRLQRSSSCDPTVLAWFIGKDVTSRVSTRLPPAELSNHVKLDLIKKTKDGDLYIVKPLDEAASCERG
jgi:hypothetical protein